MALNTSSRGRNGVGDLQNAPPTRANRVAAGAVGPNYETNGSMNRLDCTSDAILQSDSESVRVLDQNKEI